MSKPTKLEKALLRRIIRMACDAVLTMDKLAGFNEARVQQKLIARYSIYFELDEPLSKEAKAFAREVMNSRIKEEADSKSELFLYKCRRSWLG